MRIAIVPTPTQHATSSQREMDHQPQEQADAERPDHNSAELGGPEVHAAPRADGGFSPDDLSATRTFSESHFLVLQTIATRATEESYAPPIGNESAEGSTPHPALRARQLTASNRRSILAVIYHHWSNQWAIVNTSRVSCGHF